MMVPLFFTCVRNDGCRLPVTIVRDQPTPHDSQRKRHAEALRDLKLFAEEEQAEAE